MNFDSRSRSKRLSLLQLRASAMREQPTRSESLLWSQLRSSLLGTPFRRQVVLGGRFIADFVAPREKLIVEVDGPYHSRRQQADASRDRALTRLGFRILRLSDELVLQDLPRAVALVREALAGAE